MAENAPILIVALSGRALAAAARRSGYHPIVADLFNDVDTQHHAVASVKLAGSLRRGFGATALLQVAAEIAPPPVALVYGSGFDRRARLLGRLAAGRELLGNSPATMRRMKDPATFFAFLDMLGIAHPETSLARPRNPRGWLAKRVGGGGGAHIRLAGTEAGVGPHYYQRRTAGRSVSALLVADGHSARVLGYTEQWSAPGLRGAGFRYGGAVFPASLPDDRAGEIDAALCRLAMSAGLVGVNSVDMLLRDDGYDVLEVNPRPGATVDIFDTLSDGGLFETHVRACQGSLPDGLRLAGQARASAIAYADQNFVVPRNFDWPGWVADIPRPDSRIRTGDPVCTISAADRNPAAARRTVVRRIKEILAAVKSRAYSGMTNRVPATAVGTSRHAEVMP